MGGGCFTWLVRYANQTSVMEVPASQVGTLFGCPTQLIASQSAYTLASLYHYMHRCIICLRECTHEWELRELRDTTTAAGRYFWPIPGRLVNPSKVLVVEAPDRKIPSRLKRLRLGFVGLEPR